MPEAPCRNDWSGTEGVVFNTRHGPAFLAGKKKAGPVLTGFGRFELIYNGAKSVGTVPAVFCGFQNSVGGARSVFG
jgi:hypothetical protein